MNKYLAMVLTKQKNNILKKWQEAVMAAYQLETAAFAGQQADRFANPVGYTITNGLSTLLDHLLEGRDIVESDPVLDKIIQIRAVQDLTPSQAVGFVFELKPLIRHEIGSNNSSTGWTVDELQLLDSRIDDLTLAAFTIYTKHRERLYELKTKELKQKTKRLMQWVNMPQDGQDANDEKQV